MSTRSGIGVDVHPLVDGLTLVLGGVAIPFDKGLSGHSDGDVLVHAVIDAVLGGVGLGDIGQHFPSTDPDLEGIESTRLLERTAKLVSDMSWRTTYVDATILAESPVLGPFLQQMSHGIAFHLGLDEAEVNIKATTTDYLGFIGRCEGIAAVAVATVESI